MAPVRRRSKFGYAVTAGQNTADLTVTGLVLAGGATIKDAAGNNAVLSGAVTNPAGVLQIDTKAPTVASISTSGAGITGGNGDLDAGKVVMLTVDFSEKVTVTGHPVLKLNDGGLASYFRRHRYDGAQVHLRGDSRSKHRRSDGDRP